MLSEERTSGRTAGLWSRGSRLSLPAVRTPLGWVPHAHSRAQGSQPASQSPSPVLGDAETGRLAWADASLLSIRIWEMNGVSLGGLHGLPSGAGLFSSPKPHSPTVMKISSQGGRSHRRVPAALLWLRTSVSILSWHLLLSACPPSCPCRSVEKQGPQKGIQDCSG